MKGALTQDLLEFPCDFVFKAFGEHQSGEQFRQDVLAAVCEVVPVGVDALRQRDSSSGKYLCLSIVARMHNRSQIEAIYAALKRVNGLCYLL